MIYTNDSKNNISGLNVLMHWMSLNQLCYSWKCKFTDVYTCLGTQLIKK